MYDFDELVDRRGTCCLKWDAASRVFQSQDAGLLPMWVADMDFRIAPAIARRMREQIDRTAFGYGSMSQEAYDAVINWMRERHHYEVKREWFCFTPGVVAALFFAVDAFSRPGEDVMVCPPVYGPFLKAIEHQGRNAVKVPLLRDGTGYYTFDFDGMERAVTANTRVLMLCSPHNPVGRVWTREELERVADFALRHDLVVVDDEIHHDIVFGGHEHIMLGRISQAIAQRSVICTAPSKTFNVAGLNTSNIFIPDEELRQRFKECAQKHHAAGPHAFSGAALIGAYGESAGWVDEMVAYIDGNHAYVNEFIAQNLPQLSIRRAEGTYLAWIDCAGLGLETEKLKRFFVEKCRLGLNAGVEYGPGGEGYMRMNLACPRAYVVEAMERIQSGVGG